MYKTSVINPSAVDIDQLLATARKSTALTPPKRNLKKKAQAAARSTGIMASILAAQGCLTLGKDDMALESSNGKGGGKGGGKNGSGGGGNAHLTAHDDTGIIAQSDHAFEIDTATLLANDEGKPNAELSVTRVFNATHGEVSLVDGVVTFTPHHGFTGIATFQYEVIDSFGNKSIANVELNFTENHEDGHGDGGGDDGHGVHPDDPAKAAEHMAAMNLATVDDATHIAVNSGSWFDPATWANGEVPGDHAKVVIPDGIVVDYDGQSSVSLFTVRVDGALEFATDVDTFMEVDTLLVSGTGHLSMGSVDNPISAGVDAVIQIADNGPIDVAWDPMLLSRGVISHGTVNIHGAEKETFLKVAVDPMAGDTTLTLDGAPTGWEVGDKLVLTGTHLTAVGAADENRQRDITTEDEELIITKIEGNVIHFDTPLVFDHDTPRSDLKAYVANMSRNVEIRTENGDDVPVHQRGHVMFMHSDNVDVRYLELNDLGRTDKSIRAEDAADIDNIASDSNVKGRYALHIHRAGVSDLDDPVMFVGNAVNGSPGWGIVHHDSNAIIANNVVYDVFGAAFVAETGNETGRWVENIAIRATGLAGLEKDGDDVAAFDNGRTGTGFWFQGRLVDAIDNVAASMPGGQGFVYMTRGSHDDLIDVDPANWNFSDALRYLDGVFANKPALSQFSGNESIATESGLVVIKANPTQGHDIRSVISDFTAWEVVEGIHLQYTAHYTIINADIIGTDQSHGGKAPKIGINLSKSAIDITINGAKIENFAEGINLEKHFVGDFDFDGNFGYHFIDVLFDKVGVGYVNLDGKDSVLSGSDLKHGQFAFESDIADFQAAPSYHYDAEIILSGIKTDSLGVSDVSSAWDPHTINRASIRGALEQEGYWTLPDGRVVTLIDQYISDRATGEVHKISIPVTIENTNILNPDFGLLRTVPEYHGVFDVNSNAPTAMDDFANVSTGGSIVIDVLANDSDPDGDILSIDGFVDAEHGQAYDNGDGTFTYVPDPGFEGTDEFWYWVEDDNGNLAKGHVQVSVEI